MELEQNIKNEIAEIVKMSFECGHLLLLDKFEIATLLIETYPDKSNEELKPVLDLAWEYRNELFNLGPVGFYEEFKDTLDFDPDFVAEYGHYYDDEEEDEDDE
jgi:hypothetical protein